MKHSLLALAIACIALLGGCHSESPQSKSDSTSPLIVSNQQPTEPPPAGKSFDRDQEIAAAESLEQNGKLAQAAASLQQILLTDPDDVEVLFRLASVEAAQGKLGDAVALLESIPEDHPEAGLPALGQAADWCMKLKRYDDAEAKYQKVVARNPGFVVAHRQLAFLYNRQGRRHEAASHLRTLCRLGDIRQDELHALMILTNAIFDDPHDLPDTAGGRLYLPIGPAATARMLSTANRHEQAVAALDDFVRSGRATPSIVALYGRLASEAQDEERFLWWLGKTDQQVREFSDYWAALGIFLLGQHRYEEAVRSLAEAIDRDPTDLLSMRRINQALLALGKNDEADRWLEQFGVIREITLASNEIGKSDMPNPESFTVIADGLEKLHRPLEAITWRLFGAFRRQAGQEELKKLNDQRMALLRAKDAFPNQSKRLCGLAITNYPLAEIDIPERSSAPARRTDIASLDPPSFTNIAPALGLDHTYQIATEPQRSRFALFQSLGGGVAVLDYDLDGFVDLYLAQGASDPPEMMGRQSNVFYRLQGDHLVDVTKPTGTSEYRYSVGVTTGDWNQDGFADLVVANIGNKVLLINNGDGTFRRHEFDGDPNNEVLPSSVAMGDLSGDGLPDLFAIHYVEDKTMMDRPEVDAQGIIQIISPLKFNPGIDRIAVNDGTGGLATEQVSDSKNAPSTGLGVVIADWDGKPGNEVFVGNDIRPNHLWARSPDGGHWVDIAPLSGCALGHGGAPTASMGIAVADFDRSGTLDMHIANFYLEPVSLFMNQGGMFEDRCIQYKLHRDSTSVLGFGCQAIDYNNDGLADLAVTNGHIEESPGEPLQQPPQFFVNSGAQFRLTDVVDPSGYWHDQYLGRSMARLDINRDGQSDLLITHIGSPSALLLNQTESENHWLTFQLVGTDSERDAIGARVEVRAGEQTWTNWLVAGDGYLCRNEAAIPLRTRTGDQDRRHHSHLARRRPTNVRTGRSRPTRLVD